MKKTILEITQLTLGQFCLVDKYALSNTDRRVRQLRKTERAFKRAYKIDTEVLFVDAKDKALIKSKKTNGYYHNIRKHIVVFVTNDIQANTRTLLHELTHAYQMAYMMDRYKAAKKEQLEGKVSYINAWHERHARRCADLLIDGDYTRPLNKVAPYKVRTVANKAA